MEGENTATSKLQNIPENLENIKSAYCILVLRERPTVLQNLILLQIYTYVQ